MIDVPTIRRIILLVISTAFLSPTSEIERIQNDTKVFPGVRNKLKRPAMISNTTIAFRPFTINENGTWLSLIMPIIDNKTIANNTALSAENNVMIKTRVENSFTLGSNE